MTANGDASRATTRGFCRAFLRHPPTVLPSHEVPSRGMEQRENGTITRVQVLPQPLVWATPMLCAASIHQSRSGSGSARNPEKESAANRPAGSRRSIASVRQPLLLLKQSMENFVVPPKPPLGLCVVYSNLNFSASSVMFSTIRAGSAVSDWPIDVTMAFVIVTL